MISDRTIISISIENFHLNMKPIDWRKPSFKVSIGIPAPSVPAGHTYLQNQVEPNPKSSLITNGSINTSNTSTTYLRYLRTLSSFFGTVILETGILCSRSWNQPNGHKNPHTTLPRKIPNSISVPST